MTKRPLARALCSLGALAACAIAVWPAAAGATAPIGALDARAWELVSPVQKNGGNVATPVPGGGVFAAAAGGGAITYASSASFGPAAGAPPLSQYLGARSGAGWSTTNLSPPLVAGTYAKGAFQLFAADLSRALLSSGWACPLGGSCEAQNPPLGAGAPAAYRNLYLEEGAKYTPLITTSNYTPTASAADFELALEGASADLAHVAIKADGLLYEWSAGQLSLVDPSPNAALAAPAGAISADGSRLYFAKEGDLYLRQGATTSQVDEAQGGGGTFQAASSDGRYGFFTAAEHLYRYDAVAKAATDLTPSGGVVGVLAASPDGDYAYYQDASALHAWHNGATATVASGATLTAPANYPPATGAARTAAGGAVLLFSSTANPTAHKNTGATAELYRYGAAKAQLLCISCNPTGTLPLGASSVPGAYAAAEGPPSYKPRALSADGNRAFFDSADKLVSVDTNKAPDVYQWEAQGTGGCAAAAGCLGLISGGRVGSSAFLDASADGTDAYFLTATSLLPIDTGATDVYDARAGGGFAEAAAAIPCEGDDCQGPPSAPDDPIPGTASFEGPANPPVHYPKVKKHHHKGKKHQPQGKGKGKGQKQRRKGARR